MSGVLGWTELLVLALLAVLLLDVQQLRTLWKAVQKIRILWHRLRFELEDTLQHENPPMNPDLRRTLTAQLRAMTAGQRQQESAALLSRLRNDPQLLAAQRIAAFYPMEQEPDIVPWLEELATSGRLLLPRVLPDRQMEFVVVRDLKTDLESGKFGLREPGRHLPATRDAIEVYLVPGIAFGIHGERVGHGAGYYDRYFARTDLRAFRIGIGFAIQCEHASLPQHAHDIRMHRILHP